MLTLLTSTFKLFASKQTALTAVRGRERLPDGSFREVLHLPRFSRSWRIETQTDVAPQTKAEIETKLKQAVATEVCFTAFPWGLDKHFMEDFDLNSCSLERILLDLEARLKIRIVNIGERGILERLFRSHASLIVIRENPTVGALVDALAKELKVTS